MPCGKSTKFLIFSSSRVITMGGLDADDELDELLETGLKTMLKRKSPVSDIPSTSSGSPDESVAPKPNLGLTFTFPGWGLDFHRDSKRRQLSIVRHLEWENGSGSDSEDLVKHKTWSELEAPTNGSPILEMPDEVLLHLLRFLGMKDLCSSRQTCKRWYNLCSLDSLWENLITFKASTSNDLPKWLIFKNSMISSRVSGRYTYSRKGYEHLRDALDAWWECGQPHGRYSSSNLCPLIRKMTLSDWCLVYEVLSTAFAERADYLASLLLKDLKNFRRVDASAAGSSTYGSYDGEASADGGAVGMELWRSLCNLWDRYIAWVKLVSLHCADLNYAVRIERVRTVETPTLYNKGIICFRSQVILSYGLRGILQAGLCWLSVREAEGSASEQDMELLCSLHHLLQELDVADDFTLSPDSYTQVKLRRCFLDGESSKDYSRSQIIAARLNTAL